MERLWNRGGATARNGKEGADGSSPSEASVLSLARARDRSDREGVPAVGEDALAGDPSGLVTGDHDNRRCDGGGLGHAVDHLTPHAVVDDRLGHSFCHGGVRERGNDCVDGDASSPNVADRARVSPMIPILLARYAIETGLAIATDADAMLITRPQPRPRIKGRKALHMSIVPFRLTLITCCQSSKSSASHVAASNVAALLTRMSTRPRSASTRARAASTLARSLMSSVRADASPPASATSWTVSH